MKSSEVLVCEIEEIVYAETGKHVFRSGWDGSITGAAGKLVEVFDKANTPLVEGIGTGQTKLEKAEAALQDISNVMLELDVGRANGTVFTYGQIQAKVRSVITRYAEETK